MAPKARTATLRSDRDPTAAVHSGRAASQRSETTGVSIPHGRPAQRLRHFLRLSHNLPHASMSIVHESLVNRARE